MFIRESSLAYLAACGELTLQIPTMSIFIGEPPAQEEEDVVELPDEWFCFLRGYVPAVRGGYLHFTRAGYEANKERLREAFEGRDMQYDRTDGRGWPAFEEAAEAHFQLVEEACRKEAERLEQKIIRDAERCGMLRSYVA